ncbi:MAG: hypothetical protein JWM93_3259 [Frankiales bacterium]|nr:hypothetical protein [Frankiales bacterium]
MRWQTWQLAMTEALYGDRGFYRMSGAPRAHFRTSAHLGNAFADTILALAERVDARLGTPASFDLCDLGAGAGELLAAVAHRAPASAPALAPRLRLTGVDIAPRPPGLGEAVAWGTEAPLLTGLLIANEWLDNVPLDVVVNGEGGPRLVQVDEAGNERPGPAPTTLDRQWLDTWHPGWQGQPDLRVEVGLTRDRAWARAVSRVERGAAVAIDYANDNANDGGAGGGATLTAFRDGREVHPVPDGHCDITAHVFLRSVAAAGAAVAGPAAALRTQREAIAALGISTGRPPAALAEEDPRAYVAALAAASRRGALVDPAGLGNFRWLVQPVGIADPLER